MEPNFCLAKKVPLKKIESCCAAIYSEKKSCALKYRRVKKYQQLPKGRTEATLVLTFVISEYGGDPSFTYLTIITRVRDVLLD